MRVVFLGTPEFAVPALERLMDSRHEVLAVVTQPDRRVGRGRILQASPVKLAAQRRNIPTLQFERIRSEGEAPLSALAPDIMVTCAYGQILTQNILDIARFGIVNVHASLLPKYRGAAPIQWAIINGETETGITIMQTERGVDTGDILHVERLAIGERETGGELFERLSVLGGEALMTALEGIEAGRIRPVKQDESQATRVRMLEKTDGALDFALPARTLFNLVRGVNPWPGAYAYWQNKLIKVWESTPLEGEGPEGRVLAADPKAGLVIACGRGALRLDTVQSPGGKRMPGGEFVKGSRIAVGDVLRERP